METAEDAEHKKRLNTLGSLGVACILLATTFAELTTYLQRLLGFGWWVWPANGLLAAAICVGILLSFWWAADNSAKRKSYFFFLCLFLLCFVGNAAKGLVVSASVTQLMAEFLAVGRSCKTETLVCHGFVSAAETERRQELASTFYGMSGINLLGIKADGSFAKSPTERAQYSWIKRQELESELQETMRLLVRQKAIAQNIFASNGVIAIFVFGLGGWWLGRRRQ